jgi:hypothetical protein
MERTDHREADQATRRRRERHQEHERRLRQAIAAERRLPSRRDHGREPERRYGYLTHPHD